MTTTSKYKNPKVCVYACMHACIYIYIYAGHVGEEVQTLNPRPSTSISVVRRSGQQKTRVVLLEMIEWEWPEIGAPS